jgi:hypothetical protein
MDTWQQCDLGPCHDYCHVREFIHITDHLLIAIGPMKNYLNAALMATALLGLPSLAAAACPDLPAEARASGFLQMKAASNTSKSGVTTVGARVAQSKAEGTLVYSASLKTLIFCDGTGWVKINKEP